MRLYYSQIKVKNAKLIQQEGPMIIIANHPNTLVDAWLVGNVCKQPIYYMAKGTFFNSKLKMWFLKSLNLVPINRATEAKTKGVNNTASFEECYKILEQGKTLVIFPEGNSFMERQLRELKSGTARIALEVERRNGGNLGLKVLPMGLIYLQANKFRSSILVNVGEPIAVTNHLEAYEENPIVGSKRLTADFRKHLENVLITTQSKEQEELIDDLAEALSSRYRKESSDGIDKDIDLLKKVRDRVEEISLVEPWKIEEIQNLMINIRWRLSKLKIQADFLDRRFRSVMFIRQLLTSVFFILIGFPVFLFGLFHNIIPFKITDFLLPKIVKHVEYYAPVAILLGLVLYPLNYLLLLWSANQFFDLSTWMDWVYFFLMPISGMYAYYFARYLSHISYKWNYIFLVMNEKDAILELKNLRKQLFELVFKD